MWFSNINGSVIPYYVIFGLMILSAWYIRPYYKRLMGDTSVPELLDTLGSEYRVFNGIDLTGRVDPKHLNHVVVSPYGVFVIRTQSYNGIIMGADNDHHWSNTVMTRTTVLENPVKICKSDANEIQGLLHCKTEEIIPMVVFANAAILKGNNDYTVINMTHMLKTIKKHKEIILQPEQIEKFVQILNKYKTAA